jgi:hypothetical protein
MPVAERAELLSSLAGDHVVVFDVGHRRSPDRVAAVPATSTRRERLRSGTVPEEATVRSVGGGSRSSGTQESLDARPESRWCSSADPDEIALVKLSAIGDVRARAPGARSAQRPSAGALTWLVERREAAVLRANRR